MDALEDNEIWAINVTPYAISYKTLKYQYNETTNVTQRAMLLSMSNLIQLVICPLVQNFT